MRRVRSTPRPGKHAVNVFRWAVGVVDHEGGQASGADDNSLTRHVAENLFDIGQSVRCFEGKLFEDFH